MGRAIYLTVGNHDHRVGTERCLRFALRLLETADFSQPNISTTEIYINNSPGHTLRGAELTCSLRGDGLNINTAQCYFWAHIAGNRWHCHAQPIAVSEGKWADEPTVLTLTVNESQWYRSWLNPKIQEATLDQVLAGTQSYGFSFVGFGSEVSGRLALGKFEIKTR